MIALQMEFPCEISLVTPEAQNALVEIFRVLEGVGGKAPSNAVVFAAARGCGISFDDGSAKALLAKFRAARPGAAPRAHRLHTSRAPGFEHERPSLAPVPPLPHPDDAGATRAGDKVLLVPNPDERGSAGAHDDVPFEQLDRSAKSPGFEFAIWFFGAMFGAGIDKAKAIAPGATGMALAPGIVAAAAALVETHGIEECKIRARRMFARKNRTDQHRLLMPVSPAKLLEHWEMFDRDDVGKPAEPVLTAFQQRYEDRIAHRLGVAK